MASLRGRLLAKRSHPGASNNSTSSNNSHRTAALTDEDSSGARMFEKSDEDDDDDDVSSISCEPFEHQRQAAIGSQAIPDLMIMTDRSDNRSPTSTETSDLARKNNNNNGSGKNRYESTHSNNKSELNKLSTSEGFASANRSKHKKRLELAHKLASARGNRTDVKGSNATNKSSSKQTVGGNDFNKASMMLGTMCDIASIKLPITNSQKETIFRLYNLEMEKLDKELQRLDEEEMELKAKNATLLQHYDELRDRYIKHMGVDSLPMETDSPSPEVGHSQPLTQEMASW